MKTRSDSSVFSAPGRRAPCRGRLPFAAVCCMAALVLAPCCFGKLAAAPLKTAKISRPSAVRTDSGRTLILGGNADAAIAWYAPRAQKSTEPVLVAEYAYALALKGIDDAALINLDRIGSRPDGSETSYLTAQVFALMGYDDIAAAFWKPSDGGKEPSWIAPNAGALLERRRASSAAEGTGGGGPREKFIAANALVTRGRCLQAMAAFREVIKTIPGSYLPYVGYSAALERIGELEMAARAVETALPLVGDAAEDQQTRRFLEKRLTDLRNKAGSAEEPAAARFLPAAAAPGHPRMMAFGGASFSSASTSLVLRLGYFISDHSNGSLNLGFSGSPDEGLSLDAGLSIYGRKGFFVYGAGLMSSGGGWYMVCSGGAEIKLRSKGPAKPVFDRIQVFLDVDLGFSESAPTTLNLSFGFPLYFGTEK